MSIILLDVDGVVAALHETWLMRYNADYGDDLTLSRITTWDMVPHVKPECGKRIYDYLHAPDLYDAMPAVDGAIEGVLALSDMGHRVVFVTSCVGPEMAKSKLRWLFDRKLLPDGMRDVVLAHDKSLVRGDLMIDDYPKNLDDFGGCGVLFDAPYNRRSTHRRAVGWGEVVDRVREALP